MLPLCVVGALLNFGIHVLVLKNAVPLYLDTILTISLAFSGGLFWGSLCGVFSGLIGTTLYFWSWSWTGYLFIICHVATAFISCGFVRFFPEELNLTAASVLPDGAPRKISKLNRVTGTIIALMLLSFVLCIVMSVLGGSISAFINFLIRSSQPAADVAPESTLLTSTMFPRELPLLLKEILARVPVNIIDRLISVFAGYGIALWLRAVRLHFGAGK
jgi:hypothetical protein